MEYQVSTLNFFLSHTAEIFRRGILYCCINFGYQKSLERRGEYRDVPSKISCLTLPKQFAGNPSVLCFRKFPVAKKFTGLTVSKNFLGEPFRVSLNSGIEEVWIRGGGYQDFLSNVFCLTLRKFSVGESSNVALISGTKKVCKGGGGVSRCSAENFLSNSARKFRRGTL